MKWLLCSKESISQIDTLQNLILVCQVSVAFYCLFFLSGHFCLVISAVIFFLSSFVVLVSSCSLSFSSFYFSSLSLRSSVSFLSVCSLFSASFFLFFSSNNSFSVFRFWPLFHGHSRFLLSLVCLSWLLLSIIFFSFRTFSSCLCISSTILSIVYCLAVQSLRGPFCLLSVFSVCHFSFFVY